VRGTSNCLPNSADVALAAGGSGVGSGGSSSSGVKSVSKSDFKNALHDLLRRSEIPLDLERESLLNQIVDLNAKSEHIEKELTNEKKQNREIRSNFDSLNSSIQCIVCTERHIDHVVIPCGHTFCGECLQKLTHCSFCRVRINQKLKLFFGGEDNFKSSGGDDVNL
jgi:hypothetical protein